MAQATSSGGSPSQIIVGFDGSDLSMRALPVAHVLAQGTGDTIVLLEVVGNDNEIDEAKNDLAEPVNRLASTGVNVESLVVVGKPAERIIDVAGDRQARLIIMATHGRSGLGRWIYGSVADEVMRTSATPTVMIPTGFSPRVSTTGATAPAANGILVALDGSVRAEHSLPGAITLAKDLGGRVVLVRIVVPMMITGGGAMIEPMMVEPIDTGTQNAEAEAYLQRATEYVRSQGVDVESHVVEGQMQINTGMLISSLVARETATLLDRIAGEHNCGLIALTTQGQGGLGRALLGSVATAVVQHAKTPVLISRVEEDAVGLVPGT